MPGARPMAAAGSGLETELLRQHRRSMFEWLRALERACAERSRLLGAHAAAQIQFHLRAYLAIREARANRHGRPQRRVHESAAAGDDCCRARLGKLVCNSLARAPVPAVDTVREILRCRLDGRGLGSICGARFSRPTP